MLVFRNLVSKFAILESSSFRGVGKYLHDLICFEDVALRKWVTRLTRNRTVLFVKYPRVRFLANRAESAFSGHISRDLVPENPSSFRPSSPPHHRRRRVPSLATAAVSHREFGPSKIQIFVNRELGTSSTPNPSLSPPNPEKPRVARNRSDAHIRIFYSRRCCRLAHHGMTSATRTHSRRQ